MKSLVNLAGLDFDDLDIMQSASWIAARPAEAPFGYVVTPNADHLVRVSRDPELRAIYRGAALCLLDSRVVAWLARLMGMLSASSRTRKRPDRALAGAPPRSRRADHHRGAIA